MPKYEDEMLDESYANMTVQSPLGMILMLTDGPTVPENVVQLFLPYGYTIPLELSGSPIDIHF